MNKGKKLLWAAMLCVLPCLGYAALTAPDNSKPLVTPMAPETPASSQAAMDQFLEAVDAVKKVYVEDISNDQIMKEAISGMLEKLDPHSAYLDEKAFKALKISTDGSFSGIGIEVEMKNDALYVVTPLDGSPADKAGIQAGDLIIRIDGRAVKGMDLDEAVEVMRGKKGMPVELVVVHPKSDKPVKISVVRDNVKLVTVKSKILDQYYGYLRISSFQENTGDLAAAEIKKLMDETHGQMRGIIVDLRNNPGGVLQASVDVANLFLDANKLGSDKKVVYTKGRLEDVQFEGKVTGSDLTHGVPLVVLINHGTASAAEIVAAALQDHNRAILMGTQSFGKGSVQTVFPLPDGKTAIKLTTARYYTPNGHAIQAVGITPDVVVESVRVQRPTDDTDNLFLTEANLPGHLHAEVNADALKTQAAHQTDEQLMQEALGRDVSGDKPIIYKDFQLYEALVMLKGLVSLEQ